MTQARWPIMMKRKTAAEYVDMTEAAFEREIVAGRLPAGVMFGGREHWRKDAIDAAIDRLSGSSDEPDWQREWREKYGQAA
jgi:hypothetical protein